MSEPTNDPANAEPAPAEPPRDAPPRWVKSQVIGEDLADRAPANESPPPPPDATRPLPVPNQPPVTEEEISGARWFAVAFLAIVIPLGLVLFVLIVWGFVRSIVDRSGP
jgi:hypothetical protein